MVAGGLGEVAGAGELAVEVEVMGGVAAELVGVAGSGELPDDPLPHDAHTSAARTIATARMGSLLPIHPGTVVAARSTPRYAWLSAPGAGPAIHAAQAPLQCSHSKLDARRSGVVGEQQ